MAQFLILLKSGASVKFLASKQIIKSGATVWTNDERQNKNHTEEDNSFICAFRIVDVVDAHDKKTLKMNARSMVSVKPRFWVEFFFNIFI